MLGRVVSSLLLLRRGLLLLFFAGVEGVEDVETGLAGGLDMGIWDGRGMGGFTRECGRESSREGLGRC